MDQLRTDETSQSILRVGSEVIRIDSQLFLGTNPIAHRPLELRFKDVHAQRWPEAVYQLAPKEPQP